jgi:hypothetical protein
MNFAILTEHLIMASNILQRITYCLFVYIIHRAVLRFTKKQISLLNIHLSGISTIQNTSFRKYQKLPQLSQYHSKPTITKIKKFRKLLGNFYNFFINKEIT